MTQFNRSADNKSEPTAGPSRGSMLIVFLTVFIDLLGFGLVLPLLPVYADLFVIDPQGWQLGLLMASFSLMQFLVAPLWGSLSDRIGRRPVLMIGLAGSVVFYLIFAVAAIQQSIFWLFVSRIGAGIAGATIPTAQAYIADCTTPETRTRGMALIGMAFGMGFTFGPLIGFLAVPSGNDAPGPWPGYVAAGLSLVALIGAAFLLPESLRRDRNRPRRTHVSGEGIQQVRKSPALSWLFLAIFVCVFSFSKFETTLSLLVKGPADFGAVPFHFTWKQLFGTYALIGLTLAFIQGGVVRPVSKHVSERVLSLVGVGLEIVGFVVLALAVGASSLVGLFAGLFLIVAGFSCMQPAVNSLVSRHTHPDHQGVVLGMSQSVNALGRILGSALGVVLLKVNLTLPSWVSALLLLAAGVLIFRVGRLPYPRFDSPSQSTPPDR